MLVRINDLVVLESNRAMTLFQPFEMMEGYEGQSLWYQTHWQDYATLESIQKKLMSRDHVVEELSFWVRLRRIMNDQTSANIVCTYRSQHISVVHVSPDQSTMLCIFLPPKRDLAPIATGQRFLDQFEKPQQQSMMVSSTAYDLIEDFESKTAQYLPQRILKAMGAYNSLHGWLASVAVLNIKTYTVFSIGDDVGNKRGVVSMSVFLVSDEHHMDLLHDNKFLEPFLSLNFARENRMYGASMGGDTYVVHLLRIDDDDANHNGEISLDAIICCEATDGTPGKPTNSGGVEYNMTHDGKHHFTLISPVGSGHRPTL
jgi:hypothetical protein